MKVTMGGKVCPKCDHVGDPMGAPETHCPYCKSEYKFAWITHENNTILIEFPAEEKKLNQKPNNMNKVNIAQVCHEVNRAYCLSLGDTSQPTWENAPEWQKDSAVKGVEFHLKNPDATPEMSHESWLKQKQEEGWKYGEVKNPETKEHPCFRPYNELPADQRSKDYIFKQTIESLRPFVVGDIAINDMAEEAVNGLSFGQKAAGVNFNPGGNSEVTVLKQIAAQFIDQCDVARNLTSNGSKKRYYSKAISEMEDAQMNAVKAATWAHE